MASKTWTWTAMNGNKVTVTYELTEIGIGEGILANSAGKHKVKSPGKVQGRPVISFLLNGKPAYQTIPQDVYDSIIQTGRDCYVMTRDDELERARINYLKALEGREDEDVADAIRWRKELCR